MIRSTFSSERSRECEELGGSLRWTNRVKMGPMTDDIRTAAPVARPIPPDAQMNQILSHFWMTQAISVVTRLGVPEILVDEAKPVAQIAAEVGAHAPTLNRLLRGLAERGVFAVKDGGYALTPLGNTLRRGTPGSQASMAVMLGSDWQVALRAGFYEGVRTGRSPWAAVDDGGIFGYLDSHPEDAEVFNEAMIEVSASASAVVAARYDFGRFKTLVDVGGGQGYLLAAVLAANPTLRGVLFDQADVIAGAQAQLERHGVTGRCELVAGSFFETVPDGADGYIVSKVLHDWDDESALAILRNIATAMRPDATLLISEWVLPDDETEPDPVGRVLDVQMFIVTDSGRERTQREFSDLLNQAGLRLVRVLRDRPALPALLEAVLQ